MLPAKLGSIINISVGGGHFGRRLPRYRVNFAHLFTFGFWGERGMRHWEAVFEPGNIAVLRRRALDVARQDPSKGLLSMKLKRAGWGEKFLSIIINGLTAEPPEARAKRDCPRPSPQGGAGRAYARGRSAPPIDFCARVPSLS